MFAGFTCGILRHYQKQLLENFSYRCNLKRHHAESSEGSLHCYRSRNTEILRFAQDDDFLWGYSSYDSENAIERV